MIYILKHNDSVKAIGDLATLSQYVGQTHEHLQSLSREEISQYVDCILEDAQWAGYACSARLIDGQIFLGLTDDEKNKNHFEQLRKIRDNSLIAYDKKISQLNRALYMATNETDKEKIAASILAWHEYAQALCDLPSRPGAPWDGGGDKTPWPKEPVVEY